MDSNKGIEDNVIEEAVGKKERGLLAATSLFFLELVKIVILAGITIGLVRYFLFKPFYVKGQSMEPNFLEKDYLIIDELSYRMGEPQRGDVVVFKPMVGNKDYYLKRIVGLPGERVKIEDGKVFVYNDDHPLGVQVEEFYLSEGTPGSMIETLGVDEYFVLGDNRDASYDSRRFGAITKKNIVGRAVIRGWPFSRVTTFSPPEYQFLD